jgi:thioredoxin 1
MYAVYHDGVIGNGRTAVLFFHASWCPECAAADALLVQWYGSMGFPLSTYKIDYDTATDLRARYGVTSQHTFVKIDGQGKALKTVIGPTNAALKTLLGA